jgi:glycosyltransferase involved in cell wall biosynthesis
VKKFSIILPVRNGGEHVKECIKSILLQTLNDFDLFVLDNNSTDGTLQWIKSLNDERIIIYPSATSLSIEENWGRIVTIPKNEYITLIGHDDILMPDYLKVMDGFIDKFPDATLYQTHFIYIDDKGKNIRGCKPMKEKENGPQFLESILQNRIDIVGTGFMMRSKDYDESGGISTAYPNLLFADFELWLNSAGKSYKATAPVEGFYFRLHQSTTSISSDIKYQQAFEKFIYFLEQLKLKSDAYHKIILENGNTFIRFYCRSLSHRILRTTKTKRENLSVKSVIKNGKKYSKMLTLNNDFKPSGFSILFARFIDSNSITRKIFLLFKKIYKKPLLK